MSQPPGSSNGLPPGYPPLPGGGGVVSGGPSLTAEDLAALKLPTTPVGPNDPTVKMFERLYPDLPPGLAEHYAGSFKNALYQWVENECKKDQDKAHQAAEDAKKRMLGED